MLFVKLFIEVAVIIFIFVSIGEGISYFVEKKSNKQ